MAWTIGDLVQATGPQTGATYNSAQVAAWLGLSALATALTPLAVNLGGTGQTTAAAGGDLTGSYPNPTLATPYIKADGSRTLSSDWAVGSHKITGLTDPASAQDAATKNYVDTATIDLTTRVTSRLPLANFNAGSAGQVLQGGTPSYTATPTLGASGTLGTLTFGNATSGTILLTPTTGALGTKTLTMPATTGTVITSGDSATVTAAMMVGGGVHTGDAVGTFPTVTLNTVSVSKGGTGLATLTAHALQVGNGTTALTQLAVGSTGQMLTGVTSGDPAWGFGTTYNTKSAAYTVATTDNLSVIDVTAPATNTAMALITLPAVAAGNKGMIVWIKKADSGVGVGQQIPIACDVGDGINGSTVNTDKVAKTTALTSNVATITTNVGHGYIVGQIVTIAGLVTNAALNGTWQIASIGSSTTFTFAFTHADISSQTENKTCIAAATWLTQQGAIIGLMSTGSPGSGAGQGWEIISIQGDSVRNAQPSATAWPAGNNSPGTVLTIVLPPGVWDVSANMMYVGGSAASLAAILLNVGSTVNTNAVDGDLSFEFVPNGFSTNQSAVVPPVIVTTGAPLPYYMTLTGTFTGSPTWKGRISARRVG